MAAHTNPRGLMITVIGEALIDLVLRLGRTTMRAGPGGSPLDVATGATRPRPPKHGNRRLSCDPFAQLARRCPCGNGADLAPAAEGGGQTIMSTGTPGRCHLLVEQTIMRAPAVARQARTAPAGCIRPCPRKCGLDTVSGPATTAAAPRCLRADAERLTGAELRSAVRARCCRYRALSCAGSHGRKVRDQSTCRCGHRPAGGAGPGEGRAH
jgi:hypothetical protein